MIDKDDKRKELEEKRRIAKDEYRSACFALISARTEHIPAAKREAEKAMGRLRKAFGKDSDAVATELSLPLTRRRP